MNIKSLLYDEKFTIEGARKMLSQPVVKKDLSKSKPSSVESTVNKKTLMKIRSELKSILDELEK